MMRRRFMSVLLALLMSVCLVGGQVLAPGGDAYAASKTVKVKSVNLNHKTITLKKGKTIKLKTTILPKKAASKAKKKLVWKSSNKKIATVSSTGKVKAKKAGKVTITASVKGTKKKAKCTIYVGTPLKKIKVAKKSITLTPGEKSKIKVIYSPKKAKLKKVTYKSSDTSVVKVSAKGQLRAMAPGKATVTVTPKDESAKPVKIKVTVKASGTATPGTEAKPSTPGTSSDQDAEPSKPGTSTDQDAEPSTPGTSTDKDAEPSTPSEPSAPAEPEKTPEERTTVTASSNEAIQEALKNKELRTLEIKTDEESNLTIGEGEYENVSVVVDAPKAHIENHARFKDVRIERIGESTWVEFAAGNSISYGASSGRLEVASDAYLASLEIADADRAGLNLVNNGQVGAIRILVRSTILISGGSSGRISAESSASAEITTNQPLDFVSMANDIRLTLESGAEETRVEVTQGISIPEIYGLGRIEVTQGTSVSYVVAGNNGNGAREINISGRVRSASGKALEGVLLYAIPYVEGLTENQVADSKGNAVASFRTDEDGSYSAHIPIGNYHLLATKSGYSYTIGTVVITERIADSYAVPQITLVVADQANKKGNIKGQILNAETGDPVPAGLTVELRQWVNNLSGSPLKTAVTTASGEYTFPEVPFGSYTILILDKREGADVHYIMSSFDLDVTQEGVTTAPDRAISAVLDGEDIRFVLTWGNEASGAPSDLDSHLIGPAYRGEGKFHTWYSDRDYYSVLDNEELRVADLDHDDTDWEGPETTTIRYVSNGVYHFYIHDFTNGGSEDSDALAGSGATVKVYRGEREIRSFAVPNKPGTLWYVCDYDAANNTLTPKNEMSYYFDELRYIGSDSSDRLRAMIAETEGLLEEIEAGEYKTKGATLLEEAKKALDSGDEQKAQECREQLESWCTDAKEGFEIWAFGENIYDSWAEREDDGSYLLRVRGMTRELPAYEIRTDADEGEEPDIEITSSDRADFAQMVRVTNRHGVIRKYYVSYERTNQGNRIDSIHMRSEEDTELLRAYDEDWSYWGDEDEEIRVLCLRIMPGTEPSEIYDKLVIEPLSEQSEVVISPSDKTGYDRKITIRYKDDPDCFLEYYAYCKVDENAALGIKDVAAYDEDGEELYTYYSLYSYEAEDYDELSEDLYELNVKGRCKSTEEVLKTLSITPEFSGATVSRITASDSNFGQYDGMFTITIGDLSRTYYIKYSYQPYYEILDIYYTDENGKSRTMEYDWDTVDCDDADDYYWYYTLTISGASPSFPDDITIIPYEEGAHAYVADSDRDGYERTVVVDTDWGSRTYYVEYVYDPDAGYEYTDDGDGLTDSDDEAIGDNGDADDVNNSEDADAADDVNNSDDPDAADDANNSDDAGIVEDANTSDDAEAAADAEGRFLEVSDSYDILNAFRADQANLWYWNEDDSEKVRIDSLASMARDEELEEVAKVRAEEAWIQYYENGVATHDRPDGSRCFTAYPDMNGMAENLAWGYESSADVIEGWAEKDCNYAGQGHRRNMLNEQLNAVGIACYTKDGKTCWAMALGLR